MSLNAPVENIRNFSIVFDTNMLYADKKDKSAFSFVPQSEFSNFLEFRESMNVTAGKLYIPRLCIDEIIHQKLSLFEKYKKQFQDLSEYFNQTIPELILTKEQIQNSIECFCQENSIEIIEYPDTLLLHRLKDRVMEQRPPFHHTETHSDYGFKDVLLWESLLARSLESTGKVILCSKDKIFTDNKLSSEFREYYPSIDILVLDDWKKLKEEYVSLQIEIIANANIHSIPLLAFLQNEYIGITQIIESKLNITKIDDWVVRCRTEVIQNGKAVELDYFYDVQNQEYCKEWIKDDKYMEKNTTARRS